MKYEDAISFGISPIGLIVSPFKDPRQAPRQGRGSGAVGKVMVFPRFQEAMEGIEPGMEVILVMFYHRADRERLKTHPQGDTAKPERGVFSLRSPHRPNPIALSTVRVLEVLGDHFTVMGIDALDGTPVLDIKPFVRELDCPEGA